MPTGDYQTTDSSGSYALGVPEGEVAAPEYQKSNEPAPYDDASVLSFFEDIKAIADAHRKPREIIWDQCWDVYNNQHDWSKKAWWQHKVPIPKVRSSVDRAVALFRKTLLRMYPFYGIQAESKLGRTKGRYTMLLTDYHFDQIGIIEELVAAFKVGLITSTSALKIWMARVKDFKPEVRTISTEVPTYEFGVLVGNKTEEQRKVELKGVFKAMLGVAVVNPKNLWVVPGTNKRDVIERFEIQLSEIESLVDEGVYDKEAVEQLREKLCGETQISKDTTDQTTEGKVGSSNYLKMVEGFHYWGDYFDKQGKLLKCDQTFTVAEGLVIRKMHDNPFFHKRPPYVIGTPYTIPFSTYNRGMVEDIREIAESITDMANLIADGALYDAMKSFAIDVDQLDDPSDAKGGMYPGKTWLRKSGLSASPGESLIQTVEVGHVPTEAMNMIAMFEKYHQEGSYVNEWVGGFGGKGDRTLGEVNIKTQSALEGLDEAARNLEVTVIEPMLDLSGRVIYQYHENYMLQRLVDNYPQLSVMLQGLSAEERYSMMVGDFSFKVRGLSVMIDRQQRMGELKEILTLLSYLPGFVERMNPDAVLEEILMPIGWDPRRLLLNPSGGDVTVPTTGAAPPPPMVLPPPGSMTGNSPMQNRNAGEGARMGGAANNPNARSAAGGNQQALQFLLQRLMAGQQTRGFFPGGGR